MSITRSLTLDPPVAAAQAEPRAGLLLVDDQPANLVALQAILGDLGQNLVLARSGHDALRRVLEQDFALVLMDVRMPDMTGLEAASLIRQRDKSRHTPIIFLTAHDDPGDVQRFEGYSLGAVDYLVKPIVPEILRSKVSVFVDLYRKNEQIRRQALAEERQRWEMERLREANAREREMADALRRKADELMQTVAERVRAERELAAVRDELAVQLGEMTRLHRLGTRLMASLELPPLLQEVLQAVASLQNAELGALYFRDPEHDDFYPVASIGFSEEYLARVGRISCAACGPVLGGGEARVIEDVESSPAFAPYLPAARLGGYRALHSAPLLTRGGQVVGAMAAYFREPHRPSEREVRLVELYARQAAQAIENARLHQEIREASRRKDEFLAMLAHELRNPLAPVVNALEVMRRDPAAGGQSRAIVERQVRQITRLVDDLLDVSRITRGKIVLRRETVDLGEVVGRAVESTRPLIDAARHRLEVCLPSSPIRLEADPTRLEQVLANLLNNAAKYTPPGGALVVEAHAEGDEAVVRVKDNGLGIAPELLPRVFELFMQADRSLDRAQGGLGIGLTLVQRLVAMHGGTVEAYSAGLGQGSEFTVRLPSGRDVAAPASRPAEAETVARRGPSLTILVVEDSVDTAETLAMLLRLEGHQVFLAHDGRRGLEAARTHRPDVALMDIGLPGLDGLEVARRLREQSGLAQTVLVAMTGYGQERDRDRARAAGFDHHLVKPVDWTALQEVLSTVAARLSPA